MKDSALIGQLIEFIKDRHNVHKTIKNMVQGINATYKCLCNAKTTCYRANAQV